MNRFDNPPPLGAEGFTLIELMVVIALIGIIATAGLLRLGETMKDGRDARRKSDLKKMETALAVYYMRNKVYPATSGGGTNYYTSEPSDVNATTYYVGPDYIPGLVPTYMSKLPRDPLGAKSDLAGCTAGNWNRAYWYRSDGTNYKILAHCSPETTMAANDVFYDPHSPTTCWMVCTGEPACSSW